MLAAKQTADLITMVRGSMGIWLAWIGLTQRAAGLPLAVWIMLLDWTGDSVDGAIARRSRIRYRTWIGDHDLQVDMLVSVGLLVFLVAAGYWGLWQAAAYLLVWTGIFWLVGVLPALGMLFQAPIYGWFIMVAVREAPAYGLWLLAWVGAAVVLTWPKFPQMIVPGFLNSMRQVGKHRSRDHF